MKEIQDPRWLKLKAFRVGSDDSALSFIDRLARENRWSKGYAERVFEEYLKFVYLAALGPNPVTPSDQVDQVWHLHLCYSDSYWRELCGEILGQQLHHGPTNGGAAEGERFKGQYDYTLARYEEVFGMLPPIDIWPPTSIRFGEVQQFARVDLGESVVIRKRTGWFVVFVVLVVWFSAGGEEFLERQGISNLAFGWILVGLVSFWFMFRGLFGSRKKRRRKRKGGGAGCSGGCGVSGGGAGCGGSCGGGCGS